jgi:hypothetical protein
MCVVDDNVWVKLGSGEPCASKITRKIAARLNQIYTIDSWKCEQSIISMHAAQYSTVFCTVSPLVLQTIQKLNNKIIKKKRKSEIQQQT